MILQITVFIFGWILLIKDLHIFGGQGTFFSPLRLFLSYPSGLGQAAMNFSFPGSESQDISGPHMSGPTK